MTASPLVCSTSDSGDCQERTPAAVKQPITAAPRMPAEWEPHDATWLAWPHNYRDWPGKFAAIGWVYVEMVRLLERHERVCIVLEDAKREARARRQLDKAGVDSARVEFFRFASDRSWLRDSGPTFVVAAEEVSAVCWRFNAWARYGNWKRDRRLNRKISAAVGASVREPKFGGKTVILEGGAIDVNGLGTLLATEECLLTGERARNPGMTRGDYEQLFAEQLGGRHVLWLGRGIAGDDTGGHIDDLARFVGPGTVVAAVETDRGDANYRALRENLRRLREMADQDGRPLEVVELPMPRPLFSTAADCRRRTRISTSPTAWSWCRRSTTRTTALLCQPSSACFRTARFAASTRWILCGDSGRFIAPCNSSPGFPALRGNGVRPRHDASRKDSSRTQPRPLPGRSVVGDSRGSDDAVVVLGRRGIGGNSGERSRRSGGLRGRSFGSASDDAARR